MATIDSSSALLVEIFTGRPVPWRVKARGPPHGYGGRRRRSTVEVLVYSMAVVYTPHLMDHGPGRPVKRREAPDRQD